MDTSGQPTSITELKKLFEKSEDIIFSEFTFQHSKVFLIKCDSMVDEQMLYTVVLPNIKSLYPKNQITENLIEQLPIPELKKLNKKMTLLQQLIVEMS